MKRITFQLLSLTAAMIVIALTACKGDQQPPKPGSVVLKVAVSASGEITADGKSISIEQLADKMASLKQKSGIVHYWRENPKGGPHRNAMKVVELVVQHNLPIRMFSNPDFTNSESPQTMPANNS